MIINFLNVFTEYISVVLCLYKVKGKRFKLSWWSLFDFVCWVVIIAIGESTGIGKLVLYIYLFVYTKIRVADTWKQAIKPFGITMCTIPMIQLLIFAIIGEKLIRVIGLDLAVIIINIFIMVFFIIWKQEYVRLLMDVITKFRKVLFLALLLLLFNYLITYYSEYKVMKAYLMEQIVICFLIVALMFILWVNSENEKRHKAEELRTYQLYTKTFEDAVATIRMKQHEFDNHINAIRCMRYTIQDTEELIYEQDKYCDKIRQDNRYNKLLKLNTSPILIGYLYSKFTAASVHDINIEYEIQDINIECIEINDLIEIIGILFDNAVEALEEKSDKEIEVKLVKSGNVYIVSIANVSEWKTNNEIEKFLSLDIVQREKGRGVGLHRINMLLKKYKASIQVENLRKNNLNYLCFQINFES